MDVQWHWRGYQSKSGGASLFFFTRSRHFCTHASYKCRRLANLQVRVCRSRLSRTWPRNWAVGGSTISGIQNRTVLLGTRCSDNDPTDETYLQSVRAALLPVAWVLMRIIEIVETRVVLYHIIPYYTKWYYTGQHYGDKYCSTLQKYCTDGVLLLQRRMSLT